MKFITRHIILYSIRTFLLVFWLYVALDKLWEPSAFRAALLRQPFPDPWADVLYWLLPVGELILGLLFLIPTRKRFRHILSPLPFLLSAFLMLAFTMYIGLGVAGFYAQRPCGCASVFSGISWAWHLVINIVLLGLSIVGYHLISSHTPTDSNGPKHKEQQSSFHPFILLISVPLNHILVVIGKRFPRRFAVFPGRPVCLNLNCTFVVFP